MLTAWDELMCHQFPATMDDVHTTNPEWTERVYVSIYNVRDKTRFSVSASGSIPTKMFRTDSLPSGMREGSITFAPRERCVPVSMK